MHKIKTYVKTTWRSLMDWIIQARFTTSDRGWAIAMGSLEGLRVLCVQILRARGPHGSWCTLRKHSQ